MRCLARPSLALLGLALMAPTGARAQDAPAGYLPASSVAPGPDGGPLSAPPQAAPAPTPAPAPAPAAAPHQHIGKVLCPRCAAKQANAQAAANAMPPGKIIGCAHSKNGVCTACQAALNMPGQFIMVGAPTAPTAPAEAPGRAVASSSPKPSASQMASRKAAGPASGVAVAGYEAAAGDPAPVGVVQTNFSQGPGPMAAPYGPQASSMPGRAVAESAPTSGHEPYQAKSGGFPHPHIIAHVFGLSGHGPGWGEERARRKAEAHAATAYDNGSEAPAVTDLPASAVYGKK